MKIHDLAKILEVEPDKIHEWIERFKIKVKQKYINGNHQLSTGAAMRIWAISEGDVSDPRKELTAYKENHKRVIQRNKARVSKLVQTISQLKTEVKTLQSQGRRFERQVQKINLHWTHKIEKLDAIHKSAITKEKQEQIRLKNEIERIQTHSVRRAAKANTEQIRLNTEIDRLSQTISSLKGHELVLKERLNDAGHTIRTLAFEKAAQAAHIKVLKDKISHLEREIIQIKDGTKVPQLEKKIEILKKHIKSSTSNGKPWYPNP